MRLRWLIGMLALLAPGVAQAAGPVDVLYAGSLANLMEYGVGPAFHKATGDDFRGYGGGSGMLVNQMRGGLRRADVFISADPKLNEKLRGPDNGNKVSWWIRFADSPLVLGLNPTSRFATEFQSKPWYDVLMEPGIRIGRTDPKLDPKGARTLALLDAAEKLYHRPGLKAQVLGADGNPAQVLPEEALVGRLQSGELDVGFFYSTETSDANLPAIPLPPEIATGAAYTITMLNDAPDPQQALAFVQYLLGPAGMEVMRSHGMAPSKLQLEGDAPPAIQALVAASGK